MKSLSYAGQITTCLSLPDLELVFVELPKFTKEVDRLETLSDRWIYFIKSANQLQAVTETMETVTEIKKAFFAKQVSFITEKLEYLEKRLVKEQV